MTPLRYGSTAAPAGNNKGDVPRGEDGVALNAVPSTGTKRIKDFMDLGKFRLSSLVVGSCMAGYYMGASTMSIPVMACTGVGTMLLSMSAGTLNQIYEIDRDAIMRRTRNRPLPSGRLTKNDAENFAVTCAATGALLLNVGANELTGILGLANLYIYTQVYSPSKPRSLSSLWSGAVVGGLPPLMGWAAATGGLSLNSLVLGYILFAWQIPHFLALSKLCEADFKAAGHKGMHIVSKPQAVPPLTLNYTLSLGVASLAAPVLGLTTWPFAVESLLINGYFAYTAYEYTKDESRDKARRVFLTSLGHLPLLMAAMCFHKTPDEGEDASAE